MGMFHIYGIELIVPAEKNIAEQKLVPNILGYSIG